MRQFGVAEEAASCHSVGLPPILMLSVTVVHVYLLYVPCTGCTG